MKNVGITIFLVAVVAVLALYLVSFQVRETESALVLTFGDPTRQLTEPGWYFKWPTPIQRVYKFDSRMRVLEAETRETNTKGAVPIIVSTYVVWNIAEPLDFFNSVTTIAEAQNQLRSRVNDTQNRIISRHAFSEFVNNDPEKIRFDQIQDEMLEDLKKPVSEDFGIEIRTLGIRQLKVSEDTTKAVFERMRSERERRTEATKAEGRSQAVKIRSDAEAKKKVLLAAADARAKAIKGEGDAQAAKYYEMLEEHTELAMFLRDLEALMKTLEKKTTIVISTDTEPFSLLQNMPKIRSIESNEKTTTPNEPNQPEK